jgi:hypothetical protein
MKSMDPERFVQVLREVVRDSAVTNTISNLVQPPGRKPHEDLRRLADWYEGLDPTSRTMLARALEMAVDSAVFGFLCVLDGARAIEDGPDKGSLKLIHSGTVDRILNDPNEAPLHDLYRGGLP